MFRFKYKPTLKKSDDVLIITLDPDGQAGDILRLGLLGVSVVLNRARKFSRMSRGPKKLGVYVRR